MDERRLRQAQPRCQRPALTLTELDLGGLDDLDPRIGLDEEAYGPTFGNRLASRRAFARLDASSGT